MDTDIFPVLFIKYENLYCKNNIDTVNMINYFLNTNLVSNDFIKNDKNLWTEKKIFKISKKEIMQTNKTFLSLENKVKNYKTLYKFQPLELINKIQLIKFNKHYRFGDVVWHRGYYWDKSNKYILENDDLKDSILRRYIEKCPDKNFSKKNPNYIELLSNEIDIKVKENNYILPKDNDLVIHLRLGDLAVCTKILKNDYKLIIENYIKKYNIKKVIFCTAFHYANFTEKNLWIYNDKTHQINISKLTEMLNNIVKIPNIYFDIQSSKNPDDDLIFMTKAKFFVSDFGGFSKLVAEI